MSSMLAALPPSAQARAAQAIAEAFLDAQIQLLQPLHGGQSGSLVYKLVVDKQPYVLRMVQDVSPLQDPARQFVCTQLASEQGIAPRVHYVNVDLALSISAYVVSQPTLPELRRSVDLVAHFGDVMRRLHSGPAFPIFLDAFQMIDGGLDHLARAGVALPSVLQECLAAFELVKLAVQPHCVLAPCHNDLNPGNVLFDGQRLWLVDWEAACMGDPMLDLASLIHWFLFDAHQEAALLGAYFQYAPTKHELAKLELMKHVSWVFYALVFLLISLQAEGPSAAETTDDMSVPSFAEMLASIGRGEAQLHNAHTRRLMSAVIAQQSLEDMRRPAFSRALAYLGA